MTGFRTVPKPQDCHPYKRKEGDCTHTGKKAMWRQRQRLELCSHEPGKPRATSTGRGKEETRQTCREDLLNFPGEGRNSICWKCDRTVRNTGNQLNFETWVSSYFILHCAKDLILKIHIENRNNNNEMQWVHQSSCRMIYNHGIRIIMEVICDISLSPDTYLPLPPHLL